MERHGLACSARHRALGDARVLWDLARTWLREFGEEALSAAVTQVIQSHALPASFPTR